MSTEIIKELREQTGLSLGEIKKALDESNGDKAKALEVLSEKAKAFAEKKGERLLGAGIIGSYVYGGGTAVAMVELFCETDFVAKNEEFKALANDIAFHIVAMSPTSLNNEDGLGEETALLSQAFIKDPSQTIGEKIDAAIQKFGENTKVGRFVRYSI
ncbi:Elongation factor Ts [bioreactor metagenome]|uniref:Elongation factor Ts n=1 Tax=bioreactor metagenome TaxID=1076179 RepID=A0A644V7B9_9ZZZZ|nr:elongation factor Ts [Candidatus Elulimicrobiales bacterium]